ncbi:MAG: serine hydrolase [Pseudomonadales bacterium]|nr:serine hydrolase [Pseudomonadales bacterium]RZV49654.1 MAG: class C beta-lactamase-related serine hydrolase [Pseudomonadales bacterium]
MQGSPPPENRIIRFADGSYFRFPATRWSFSNFRRLMPTINVSRGLNATATLSQALRDDIDDIRFTPGDTSTSMRWSDSLLENYTDAVLILHQGKVVYERYFGVSSPTGQHGVMSITKTFVGTLASALIAEGVLDPGKLVTDYVPELAGSAFAGATLQQVLDMTTGIRFNEDYANPKADIWVHAKAGSPLPMPKDYQGPRSYYEFLQQTVAEGKHGEAFHYRTINTDALGWIIARATDKPLDQLLSARIWQKLGVEQDAYMNGDSIGTPFAGGGLSMGLRDLARFGEMIRNNGYYNGQQIIPAAAVADIRRGASKRKFAKAGYKHLSGWSYHNMWWLTHNAHQAFLARGVFGQALYIDPKAEVVIARFGSHPQAANSANDATSLPAFHAVAKHLHAATTTSPGVRKNER